MTPSVTGDAGPGSGDRGSGTVAACALAAVAVAALVLVAAAGTAFAARQRAQAAADLGALAGADVVVGRRGGEACDQARLIVTAHAAVLGECVVRDGGVDLLVRVRVELPGSSAWASARARAGPAP